MSTPAKSSSKQLMNQVNVGVKEGVKDAQEIGKFTWERVKKSRPLQVAIGGGVLAVVGLVVLIVWWLRRRNSQTEPLSGDSVSSQGKRNEIVAPPTQTEVVQEPNETKQKPPTAVNPFMVSSLSSPEFNKLVMSEKLSGVYDDTKSFFDAPIGVKVVDGEEMFETNPFYEDEKATSGELSDMYVQ